MRSQVPSKFVMLAIGLGLFLSFSTVAYAQSASGTATTGSTSEKNTKKKTDVERPDGWRTASHSNDVDPNYAVVFPQDAVNTLTITVSADNWAAMQANMTTLFGEPGRRRGGRPGFGGPSVGITATQPISPLLPPDASALPANGGPQFGGDFTPENPIWVTATIEFQGDLWTNVGLRYTLPVRS